MVVSSLLESSAVDAGRHVVQFYDSDADLISRAGDYLGDAARTGAVAIVIATDRHREAFDAHLRDAGLDVAAARDEGTLVSLDAATTLGRFTRDGAVDRDAFFDVVGGVVRGAAATGRPVCAYGEMVALLWDAGDVMAAIDLETLWNELATEVDFSLYCAYRSASVSGHEHVAALEQVCCLHSAVVPAAPAEATWQFAAEYSAPRHARRLVTDALRQAGHDGAFLVTAQIVITELASNAVRHARSPFTVSIRSRGSTVRIVVHDGSRVVPMPRDPTPANPSGRGMYLIAELASRWGVDLASDGKDVWAELGG
jgi:anti-sigma regulatory factor (Ser/Thr protein kinase)